FYRLMSQKKDESRQSNFFLLISLIKNIGKSFWNEIDLDAEATSHLMKQGIPPTDDSHKYNLRDIQGQIVALWVDRSFVQETKTKEKLFGIILDQTNFYSE